MDGNNYTDLKYYTHTLMDTHHMSAWQCDYINNDDDDDS